MEGFGLMEWDVKEKRKGKIEYGAMWGDGNECESFISIFALPLRTCTSIFSA